MNNFIYDIPVKVYFGKNQLGNLGNELRKYGTKLIDQAPETIEENNKSCRRQLIYRCLVIPAKWLYYYNLLKNICYICSA